MCWYDEYRNLNCNDFLETLKRNQWQWVAKRLSGNDTGLTGAHQAGIYLPKRFFEKAFPEIVIKDKYNPKIEIACYFPQTGFKAFKVAATYYNNKFFPELGYKKKFDEFRLTGWGGRKCSLQDHENTGAAIILAWEGQHLLCWIASNSKEENIIKNWICNELEPSQFVFSDEPILSEKTIDNISDIIPATWINIFPTGKKIADLAIQQVPKEYNTPDKLLIKRRNIESEIFFELERIHFQPIIDKGFHTIDEFTFFANQITNRRKSRSGRSLELHLSKIFQESNLIFDEQATTELKKKPDFLFPSEQEYKKYPNNTLELFMLAAKTCCKDRWRQITSEANNIEYKHLFTLQEGVSENQIAEMLDQKIQLVIPEMHRKSFPKKCRNGILNLKSFIESVAATQKNP